MSPLRQTPAGRTPSAERDDGCGCCDQAGSGSLIFFRRSAPRAETAITIVQWSSMTWSPMALGSGQQTDGTVGHLTHTRSLRRVSRPLSPVRAVRATSRSVSEPLRLTIVYEDAGDGWIVASVPEVLGAQSQGHTREQARANVIDTLHGILELRFGEPALTESATDGESLELVIAA